MSFVISNALTMDGWPYGGWPKHKKPIPCSPPEPDPLPELVRSSELWESIEAYFMQWAAREVHQFLTKYSDHQSGVWG